MAALCGRRIVEMVWDEIRPRDILTRRSFENALIGLCAAGGSSNAIIHLLALASRAEVKLSLDDFDRFSRHVPVLLNLRPFARWLMEDFCIAGGSRAFLHRLRSILHHGERTVRHVEAAEALELGVGVGLRLQRLLELLAARANARNEVDGSRQRLAWAGGTGWLVRGGHRPYRKGEARQADA